MVNRLRQALINRYMQRLLDRWAEEGANEPAAWGVVHQGPDPSRIDDQGGYDALENLQQSNTFVDEDGTVWTALKRK